MGALNDIREAWSDRYVDISDTIDTMLEMGITIPAKEEWKSMGKDERKAYIHALATKITDYEIEKSSQ
tara:strand:+ start:480 stop:683 length:204 start_codon:yes stop_codon:yes gene_type:complete